MLETDCESRSLRVRESIGYFRMTSASHTRWPVVCLIGLTALFATAAERADAPAAAAPAKAGEAVAIESVQLRGQVVCLPEEMHRLHQTRLPTNHEHIYGFRTTNGVYYTLLRTGLSEALFADKRLLEKELLLSGKVLPRTQIFDVTVMKSVRNGVVCDLYYYCDICAIKTVVPGPCMCCREPVELVEKPLNAQDP